MNIDQALAQADMGKEEGLRGLYPVAAQVLAKEVRELRERLAFMENAKYVAACTGDQTAATP